jgi:hypothetical protein
LCDVPADSKDMCADPNVRLKSSDQAIRGWAVLSVGGDSVWAVSLVAGVPGASTEELVEAVAACAAELAARPAPEHAGVCFEQAEALGRGTDLIESAIAARVAVADRHGEPQRWGYPSATSWMRTSLGMRHSRAEDRTVLARQLDRLPLVAKRLAAEQLSFGYASVIAAALRRLDDAEAAKGEAILLDLVDAGCSVKEVTAAGDRIRHLIAERDGTETEPEDGRRGERQWWTMSRGAGGRAFSKGLFSAELAALIRAKIEPLARPAGPEDTRDHAQRMADALQTYLSEGGSAWDPILIIELKRPIWRPRTRRETDQSASDQSASDQSASDQSASDQSASDQSASDQFGRGGVGLPVRQDAKTAGEAAAAERPAPDGDAPEETIDSSGSILPGPAAGPGGDVAPGDAIELEDAPGSYDRGDMDPAWDLWPPGPSWPFDGTAFTARLPDGTPIPIQWARQILLAAGFSALVIGSDGQPMYLGRKVRCATPHQRRAINARYRTCAVTGCDIPASLCELDHADGWANGDVTDIDKLAPLCRFHNSHKFEYPDRVCVAVGDDGRLRYDLIRPGRGP